MKMNIVYIYLLLITLLGIIVSASFAQQNQNVPKTDPEVEKLKIQLQTAENEKIELETKLAEAKAKQAEANANLIGTKFGKLKLELKNYNQQWLRNWIFIILGILSVVGFALWKRLTTKMDGLIEKEVNKRLADFEGAIEKVNILEPQVRILNKEHVFSVLERYRYYPREDYPEEIKELQEQALLDAFNDETRHLENRMEAAEVLSNRKSTRLVSPILKCLDSYIDSDFDWEQSYRTQHLLCNLLYFIGQVRTTETYETLKRFLEQLISDKPGVKRIIITSITFSLVYANSEINKNDSLSVIRKAIPILDLRSDDEDALRDLVEYFNKLQEHEDIKEIYNTHVKGKLPELEEKCLDLLEKKFPDFVKEQREEKASTDNESEAT